MFATIDVFMSCYICYASIILNFNFYQENMIVQQESELSIACSKDQQWQPKIFMDMDAASNKVDLVPFLTPSNDSKIDFICKNYPVHASFRFYGYSGSDSATNLLNDVKQAANMHGTHLKGKKRKDKTPNRVESIVFTCVKNHLCSLGDQQFNENCIQKCGTSIQPKHQANSVKGSSRSAKLKFVSSPTDANKVTKKRNKTTCATAKDINSKCKFTFIVFYLLLMIVGTLDIFQGPKITCATLIISCVMKI